MLRTAFLLALVTAPSALPAQERPVSAGLPTAESADDIIVSALRIPREELPTGVYWDYLTALRTRIRHENSAMFFHCALKPSNASLLRNVVDGEPNSATARFYQDRIAMTREGCYPPVPRAGTAVSSQFTVTGFGRELLDRGVIFETVLARYAPDAELTPAITADPAVRSRFVRREGVRNRLRLPDDRDALRLATCLVQDQPVLATRLMRADYGSPLERGLVQAMLVEGRACIGAPKRITVDPTMMRAYVADSFYRWVVAARDVDSLIVEQG